ncbi:hypothetical protein SAMN05216223_12916 [Actinacidiphila yanglinensis]|uniref:Uncharacterized protein n=1 Tax=Actinacidiphila yanglinensis TaxID=310779 RepID=A0A1H6EB58_9ACTN|nr:hypothetical protein SAMN05216223_12916 [Actinacidiphila yanglinensis]
MPSQQEPFLFLAPYGGPEFFLDDGEIAEAHVGPDSDATSAHPHAYGADAGDTHGRIAQQQYPSLPVEFGPRVSAVAAREP